MEEWWRTHQPLPDLVPENLKLQQTEASAAVFLSASQSQHFCEEDDKNFYYKQKSTVRSRSSYRSHVNKVTGQLVSSLQQEVCSKRSRAAGSVWTQNSFFIKCSSRFSPLAINKWSWSIDDRSVRYRPKFPTSSLRFLSGLFTFLLPAGLQQK